MTKLSRSILKPDRLNLTPVKSLRAIGLKRITQTLRYGLSALVRAMCVDSGTHEDISMITGIVGGCEPIIWSSNEST